MAKTSTIIIYVIMYICIIKMLLIKNMVEKKLFAKTLPVLLGFFVMGFCDIVGSIAAYCYFPKKPSIRVQTIDMSNDRQLTLF